MFYFYVLLKSFLCACVYDLLNSLVIVVLHIIVFIFFPFSPGWDDEMCHKVIVDGNGVVSHFPVD